MKVKVTRHFQITIPAEMREKLEIKEGDYVEVMFDEREGAIIVKPYRRRWTTLKLGRRLTSEEIEEIVREATNEVASSY
jgi:AbrB family looped-hinge helix DNA binding protein